MKLEKTEIFVINYVQNDFMKVILNHKIIQIIFVKRRIKNNEN